MSNSSEEQNRLAVFAEMEKYKEIQDSVKNANDGEETTVDIGVFRDMLTRRTI